MGGGVVGRMPTLRTTRRRQLLCTEPLEGRWLLSAPPALPPQIAALLQLKFPGISVLRFEFSTEDGDVEYDVTARVDAGMLDATLSADGKLLESEIIPGPKDVEDPPSQTLATAPGGPAAVGESVDVVELLPVEPVDADVPLTPAEL